ncbi:MAG: M36 family metallopeptidase, partial [Actinomycetota bacterium]|nr:M36 family metallopeptidase [Actinomycetota bacterium]
CPGTPGAGSGGYTYGDFGRVRGVPEVHSDGEIWGETLWDLRAAVGAPLAESLVTRAMEISVSNPSFLDMRNAIVQADTATNGGHARAKIWNVFAHRGMGFFAGSVDGDDTQPVEDFSLPPAPGTPRGSLTGSVVDDATGAGISGALVVFGGHASGFNNYSAVTAADGSYTISNILPGTYPKVSAGGAGYDRQVATLSIASRIQIRDWELRRDWAAASGGGTVTATNGDEYAGFGCGAAQMIDQSQGQGWSTDRILTGTAVTPKWLIIKLPVAVDVSAIGIDPSNTCGDGGSASTGPFTVETSTNGTTWTAAASGTFTPTDRGHLNTPALAGGSTAGVRYIRYTMKDSQVNQVGSCPGPFSGCDFIDSVELEVFGTAS